MRNCAAIALLLASCRAIAADGEAVQLTMAVASTTLLYQQTASMLELAFSRLNTPYTFTSMPAERSSQLFILGKIDGNVGRIAIYNQVYPAALRVEPPLFRYKLVAVSAQGLPSPKSWPEIAQYRVAYRRGLKVFDTYLAGASYVELVDTSRACLLMAGIGRVDFCLGTRQDLDQEIAMLPEQKLKTTDIGQENAYVFLGPKWTALALELGKVLSTMERNGELARFYQERN